MPRTEISAPCVSTAETSKPGRSVTEREAFSGGAQPGMQVGAVQRQIGSAITVLDTLAEREEVSLRPVSPS